MSECICCGGKDFSEFAGRENAMCNNCKSLERTRIVGLYLNKLNLSKDSLRILHFAPEKALHDMLIKYNPVEYIKADIRDDIDGMDVTYFDITKQVQTLPDNHFDLIIHNHVLEHLRCSDVYVIYHIHRALKKEGKHIFSVPIWSGTKYKADFNENDPNMLLKHFGQIDHVAAYGSADFEIGLGGCLNISEHYNLEDYLDKNDLDANNIPNQFRHGLNSSSVFVKNKDDWAYNI